MERRWIAGVGLRRVLIAGTGDLGRMVADKILEHRELGYQIVGFVDDRAGGDHLGYRGLPLLGALTEAADIATREKVDHLYVALPLEEHLKLLDLVESTSREGVDVKVVPDLLQFIALRARLEDLDGVPVINLNDIPLQGINAFVKRALDIAVSSLALSVMLVPGLIIAWLIKRGSPGPIFYHQERMGLDGKQFSVYKFRTMPLDAEERTGPVWADEEDTRATPVGSWLRRHDLDEWPQFWNVLKGEMSIVGPRPERPFFVEQFKHRIPQYMLRHKVKAGITGWAQVNGWRGNTSLEKRIEYRPLLHRELVGVARSEDHVDDAGPGPHPPSSPRNLNPPHAARLTHVTGTEFIVESRHHRRRRLHRIPSLRGPARSWSVGRRHRQPADGRSRQHRAPSRPRLPADPPRRHDLHRRRRPGGLRPALGEPGQPGGLPRTANPDAEGRRARHP